MPVVVFVLLLSCCSETASATHVPSRAQKWMPSWRRRRRGDAAHPLRGRFEILHAVGRCDPSSHCFFALWGPFTRLEGSGIFQLYVSFLTSACFTVTS
jgi:hypothetical protein